jgi:hypothetical protein
MAEIRIARSGEHSGKRHFHHIEIHPDRDQHGRAIAGGGHAVQIHRVDEDGWQPLIEEKHFGTDQPHEMLAHVANSLKLPENIDEPEGAPGSGDKGRP